MTARNFKHLVEEAKKILYLLYTRINNLYLPVDLIVKLFYHNIVSILLFPQTYGDTMTQQ